MKTNIELFPEFKKAIQENELVYLFGAGISSALTNGQSVGWKQWIINGTSYVKDPIKANALRVSIEKDNATGGLVKAAGTVLAATKADGTYQMWMKNSFESAPITNHALADTLKKLLVTQDVFATTNYDLMLERATGLSTLSYEEPDKAFPMLDRKKSDSVLHIHGVYDSFRGIDNIIADESQYEAILNDEGAQFIQNILGTRTLIFVGCGQTAEDANIARFIQFAKDKLRMDREYYFLFQLGMEPTDLPDNIKPIPYGDSYSDLPEFLADLAQERLRFRIEDNPLIMRTINTREPVDAYGLTEYHYSQEYLKFCGRKVELAQLHNFLETDGPFQWWAITGQGGSGKSRLAYECLRRCQKDFFGFFLNFNVSDSDVDGFIPFNDTIVVVDYIKGNENQVAMVISGLIDIFSRSPYKLRVLLLERDNLLLSGSWYHEMFSSLDLYHRARLRNGEYNVDLTTRQHRFLYLDDLDDAAVIELIGDVCRKKRLPEDIARDRRLKQEYAEKFEQLRFRPLFLQMYVEAWVDNGCIAVEYTNYTGLLEVVVKREEDRILQMLNGDKVTFNSLIRLIIRAGISDGIELDKLSALYPKESESVKHFAASHSLAGKQKIEYLQSLFSDSAQELDNHPKILKPLYPDIIKEFLFLYYLDREDMRVFAEELWSNCPAEFTMFLSHCAVDFQGDEDLISFIRESSENYRNTNAMRVRWSLLSYKIIHSKEDGVFFQKLAANEYAYWTGVPVNDENRDIVFRGLYYSVWQFFGWSQADKCMEAIGRLYRFECGDDLLVEKSRYLIEFTHYVIEKNCFDFAQNIITFAQAAIDKVAEGEEKRDLVLSIQREIMVSHIFYRQMEAARQLHDEIYSSIDWEDEKQVEHYAYICFSGADQSRRMVRWDWLLYFSDCLQDFAVDYADRRRKISFNDKDHYYYLHAKLMSVEASAIQSQFIGIVGFGIHLIDGLIDEIKGNEMIADFAGLLIGAYVLKVKVDDKTTLQNAEDYLAEANSLLERYPDNALLAEKAIDLWKTAYTVRYDCPVPRELVDKAYVLVLRFSHDRGVLRSFFDLLEASAEVDHWRNYTSGSKGIVDGLIQNDMMFRLFPPERGPARPVVKAHKKIRPNDPCPCGSKKKFKKCCKGKGLYD